MTPGKHFSTKKRGSMSIFLVLLFAVLIIAIVLIGVVYGLIMRGRALEPGNGQYNSSGWSVVEENATVYLTFYTPGVGNTTNGNCTFAIALKKGGDGMGNVFYRNKTTGEALNTCTTSAEAKSQARADSNYEIAVKFANGQFGRGALATNYKGYWKNGSPYEFDTASAQQGDTSWLQFPNLESDIPAVPVVDHYGKEGTDWNFLRDIINAANGIDGRRALDFAVKDNDDLAYWQKKLCTRNVNVLGKDYCVVEGVTVYDGNPFYTTTTGGSATAEDGKFTGNFPVDSTTLQRNNKDNRYGIPDWIVLHYMGAVDNYSRPLTPQEVFNNGVYVQFIIDRQGKIYQLTPETKQVGGTGGFNRTPTGGISISIENEGNFEYKAPNPVLGFTQAEVDADVRLVKYLMQKWNIPKNHVVSHKWAQQYAAAHGRPIPDGESRSDPGQAFMDAVTSAL